MTEKQPDIMPEGTAGRQAPHDVGNVIRVRAIVIGLLLAIAICLLTPYNNVYLQATPLGGGHFPLAPFFLLVLLTVFAAMANKVSGSEPWLTGRELLIIWVLTVLVSGIAYTGLVRTFFINLTAPYHFATVENRWEEALHPLLPKAWYPQSPEAITAFYDGLPEGSTMGWLEVFQQIPWGVWIKPFLVWGAFIFLCYFVMICLINLVSRQWLHNERMNLPLLQVPKLLEEAFSKNRLGRFFFNRFLLAGLSVTLLLHLMNGLNFYYPSVPHIPTLILAGGYFPEHGLFSGFHKLKIYIYPAFIGFAFLTSRQVSFSFWFFFIIGGLLIGVLDLLGYNIPAAALGVTFGPTLSRPEETQMIGAYGIFFLFLLWMGRDSFMDAFRHSFRFGEITRSRTEWVDTRLSFWGAVLGGAGIIAWCVYYGMPPGVAFLVIGAFFLVMVVASRVICQGGIAYFTLTVAPIDGLIAFFGPRFFTSIGILIAGVVQKVLFVDLRESLMPSLLHAGKLSYREKNRRMLLGGIVVTLVAGVAVSFVAMLVLCYKFGVRELQLDWATRTTVTVYENIHTLVESPVRPDQWVLIFALAGAVVMLVLVVGYHRFYWWPIHPIGYLTTYSSAMWILWFSFLIGWMCNSLCMRYGGIALFKNFRYFFIGLIVGDFLMGGAWAVVGLFSDGSYQVLPN